MANLGYNLIGYLPSPFVYGFISSVTGGNKSRWAMGTLLYSTIFSVGFLIYGITKQIEIHEERKRRNSSLLIKREPVPKSDDETDQLIKEEDELVCAHRHILAQNNSSPLNTVNM